MIDEFEKEPLALSEDELKRIEENCSGSLKKTRRWDCGEEVLKEEKK